MTWLGYIQRDDVVEVIGRFRGNAMEALRRARKKAVDVGTDCVCICRAGSGLPDLSVRDELFPEPWRELERFRRRWNSYKRTLNTTSAGTLNNTMVEAYFSEV